MFASYNFPKHNVITYQAKKRVSKCCWFIFFYKEVADPSEKIPTDESVQDLIRVDRLADDQGLDVNWEITPAILQGDLHEADNYCSEEMEEEAEAATSSNKMQKLGLWQRVLRQIKRIKFLETLESRRHLAVMDLATHTILFYLLFVTGHVFIQRFLFITIFIFLF